MLSQFTQLRPLLLTIALAGAVGVLGSFSPVVHAQQARTPNQAVYTVGQAARGRLVYQEQCATCHGATFGGGQAPPLAGSVFLEAWGGRSLWELVSKVRNTMPANDPGKLTLPQSADLVALLLEASQFPSGQTELAADEAGLKSIMLPGSGRPATAPAGSQTPSFPVTGNMQQLMVGILFPSSNMIFNVQTHDPAAPVKPVDPGKEDFSWVNWGATVYSGWELVDAAAIAISESAPLLLTPRRCQNGRPAPVDKPDWIRFTQGVAEAGRAAYQAAQTRNQQAVSDATNQLADACMACHRVYRERNRNSSNPSDKSMRCLP